jgi:hypothetical protein
MKEVKVNVSKSSFPSQTVSDSEKETLEYGLRVGQSISYEWFKKDGGSCRYYNQWAEFHRRRLYARGEQPIGKYKKELAIDGDLSHLNLDWSVLPILPKFVDIVVNGMSDRIFEVKATSQDAMSSKKRNDFQENIEIQMAGREVFDIAQSEFGVDPYTMNPDDVPESDEELSLYMQLNYKPAIEIAEEVAINTILEENKYQDIRKRIDYDQTVLGVGMAKHSFRAGAGIIAEYVDPANMVYSYTEDPYFKDVFYWGEVKTVPMTEIVKIDPDIKPEDLEKIASSAESWANEYGLSSMYENDIFYKDTATLMYFNYKTTKNFVYKKKKTKGGGERVIEKDDTFNPDPEMMEEQGFEKVSKTIDVWYEGVMVMGTNIILEWKLSENMVRPESASQHAIPNYIACAPRMYKGSIESLVKRTIPIIDLIQMSHLKLQQVSNRVVPDGVFIDADGLNEVDLGNGNAYNPEDALRLYFQTGSVIGRSFTQDGDFNNARIPIQQLTSSSGAAKIDSIIGQMNHYIGLIRDITGLNQATDASSPDPRALVGVQKLAALSSNTATRHILDSSLFIYRSMAEALSYRIADVLEYSEEFKEEFLNKIGEYNVRILDEIKDLYLYSFGIYIDIAPDVEQKAKLEENIQVALANQNINIEDAIDIREIKNVKIANQLLKVKRKKKEQADQQRQMEMKQMDAQINMQSQQAAAQAAQQKMAAEVQLKTSLIQAETQASMQKTTHEANEKERLMGVEFNMQMRLAGMEAEVVKGKEKNKEDAKDKRVDKQSTQQSKMIEQRKNNLPPVNFESNEDSLDGFGLEEFSPR